MTSTRIELLDFARGIALIAMTIFHFAFDLELFGYKEPGFISQDHWKYFARAIASSFLFLTGVSLFLAHCDGVRWAGWRVRMLKITAAAMVITIATYIFTPEQYIFFGILHAIAFASVLGLLFIRAPWIVIALVAVFVFWAGLYARSHIFDAPYLFWTGLGEARPNSSDYVPVFPWMAAPLLGIAFAKLTKKIGWLEFFAKPKFESSIGDKVKFIGRRSLLYYLLHQPVLIALIFAYSWISGLVA